MSAEIVNLRRARKAKQRVEHESRAATNRLLFGRTRGERTLQETEAAMADRRLNGHKLTDREPGSAPSDAD